MLEVMTPPPRRQRHTPSSPFQPDPESSIELYEVDDLVSHDSHGMGRVIQVETTAVTVDFRSRTVRVASPGRGLAAQLGRHRRTQWRQ
jgi:hypothetical protein